MRAADHFDVQAHVAAQARYLTENADPDARLCHCGCGHYVEQAGAGSKSRWHASEECAQRCIERRAVVARLLRDHYTDEGGEA